MTRLFINYYKDRVQERQDEYDYCLKNNLELFFEVVNISPLRVEGCTNIHFDDKPTFNDFFRVINEIASDNDVSVIANLDIYFETLTNIAPPDEAVYALTRWDVDRKGNAVHFARSDSQDAWVFKGRVKRVNAPFGLGIAGCDNKIAYLLDEAGYDVQNPSLDIKCYHLHNTGVRNYINKGRVERLPRPYMLVPPTRLENWVSQIANLGEGKYSQFNEDAIIEHIFKNIGETNRFFVDLGAGAAAGKHGVISNTRKLREEGWKGFGVDMEATEDEWVVNDFIKPDNICGILKRKKTPKEFDFLSLDIDSSDFWVLKAILEGGYAPRAIVAEINGCLEPYSDKVLEYEEGYTWDGSDKYGFSFSAGKKLLEKHGYTVIFNQHNVNIFAIRHEGVPDVEITAKRHQYHRHNPHAKWDIYE